jgi:iron complex outermembrane receptor protein
LTTGLRFTWEDRENSTYSNIADNGFGASLNPVSVNGVQTGGFATTSTGTLAAGNSASQLSLADSVAAQYFGVKATSVAGAAYKSLTAAEQLQVATAQKLRATNIGVLVAPEALGITEAHLPTVLFSPSYKFNDNYTTYVSFEYNQKAGIAEFINGVPNVVQPERTSSYEWGLKTLLPNQKLTLNADLFLTNINDYQQAIEVENLYTTNLNNNGLISYTSATGSAPRVRAEGLEVDAVYGGIKNTTLRFAGAYNNAHYVYFPNSAQPVENGSLS